MRQAPPQADSSLCSSAYGVLAAVSSCCSPPKAAIVIPDATNQYFLSFNASPPRSDGENQDERPKVDKLFLKRKGIGSEARAEITANADADLQLLGEVERERWLQKQKRRRLQGQEDEDNRSRSGDSNDYVVHDPLLEKGKEKFNKMQARQKRRE
ncbi:unnamed protein product [Fraxinus pennsylvanica]|uniref:Uncharacterized protein n=1 Tax=Fraxinus pennsylvanica TaxID=56036 RepID=A0AAD1ZPB0_9LAMI|nr:unnamed protein product [Fraxinus pennsylvanica]